MVYPSPSSPMVFLLCQVYDNSQPLCVESGRLTNYIMVPLRAKYKGGRQMGWYKSAFGRHISGSRFRLRSQSTNPAETSYVRHPVEEWTHWMRTLLALLLSAQGSGPKNNYLNAVSFSYSANHHSFLENAIYGTSWPSTPEAQLIHTLSKFHCLIHELCPTNHN